MRLSFRNLFRRITPTTLAESELQQARIELVAAERALDLATSNVDYYQRRITRLTAQVQVGPAQRADGFVLEAA